MIIQPYKGKDRFSYDILFLLVMTIIVIMSAKRRPLMVGVIEWAEFRRARTSEEN